MEAIERFLVTLFCLFLGWCVFAVLTVDKPRKEEATQATDYTNLEAPYVAMVIKKQTPTLKRSKQVKKPVRKEKPTPETIQDIIKRNPSPSYTETTGIEA